MMASEEIRCRLLNCFTGMQEAVGTLTSAGQGAGPALGYYFKFHLSD